MPDLSSLHYIYNVIVVAPETLVFIFQPAIKNGNKGLAAGKPAAADGVIFYMCIKIIQEIFIEIQN